MSDDGALAIVVIALVGNPFSPFYARARTASPASALDFCSMNVALYARRRGAWALEERPIDGSARTPSSIAIGRSSMRWDGGKLVVELDERTTPAGRPLRGKVVLHPEAATDTTLAIDGTGEHVWWPVSPLARIEVDLPAPGVRFTGHGYHDANAGEVPLEATFNEWHWSRARTSRGAVIAYDVAFRSGGSRAHALSVSPTGVVENLEGLVECALPTSTWRLKRMARGDRGASSRVIRTLEDGPFYARELVETRVSGEKVVAMHESLAAHRLRTRWVHRLTGFRMRSSG